MQFDVVGLGNIVVDHQIVLARFPEIDTKNEASEDRFQVGGPVPTAQVLLSRLGLRCGFLGCWGDDAFGDFIESDLRREGVDFTFARRRPGGRTGFAHVWIDGSTGLRTIAYRRAAQPLTPMEIDKDVLASAGALHLDGWPPGAALEAARIVQAHGGVVFLDTGSRKPGMEDLLSHVDIVSCPRRFLREFLETDDVDRARKLLDYGPRMVAVTDGQYGAALFTRESAYQAGAIRVEAVDTNGAGDVFCGGLIYGILNGWGLEHTLRFATATAGLKCTALGNREALPTREDIAAVLPRVTIKTIA